MNIFITSIEKGDGKTFIAAGIAAVMQSLGYNAGVYKPIQTGAIDKGKYLVSPDLAFVKMLDPYITTHSTYMFKSRTIPILASKDEKINIIKEEIVRDYTILTKKTDTLITESTGGLMTLLNEDFLSGHIPNILNIPVLFVVTPKINDINNFLSELNTAKTFGLDISGVIINKFSAHNKNTEDRIFPELIEKYTDIKILGIVRNFKGESIKAAELINEVINGIDIQDVFRMKIPKLNV